MENSYTKNAGNHILCTNKGKKYLMGRSDKRNEDNCVKNKGKTHACRLSSGRIFKEAGRAAGISGLCCLRIHTVQRFLLGQLAPFG